MLALLHLSWRSRLKSFLRYWITVPYTPLAIIPFSDLIGVWHTEVTATGSVDPDRWVYQRSSFIHAVSRTLLEAQRLCKLINVIAKSRKLLSDTVEKRHLKGRLQ